VNRTNRRRFLTAAAAASPWLINRRAEAAAMDAELRTVLARPVLDLSAVKQPVKVASIELLKHGEGFSRPSGPVE